MASPEQRHEAGQRHQIAMPKGRLPRATLDVAIGMGALAAGTVADASRRTSAVLVPVARGVLDPPVVPRRLRPKRWLEELARHGTTRRVALERDLSRRLDVLVPAIVAELVRRARMAEVLVRYVDLDLVVAAVNLDAAAERLDVEGIIGRVDLDRLVARVDLDAVASRLDVDAVAARLDVDAVLDRIDLTTLVLQRVDLDALVDAVLRHVDLVGIAEQVIDAIDLPRIIRDSTGSMASDTVQGARMQGIAGDEAVSRAVDRILLRRRPKSAGAPGLATAEPTRGPTVPRQGS